MRLLCRSSTPKQIDLQAFLLLQLPYCVSILLLTSECKIGTCTMQMRYHIAGFYHENFILTSHGIRNIKIHCFFYLMT